jgi:hypothetical protein
VEETGGGFLGQVHRNGKKKNQQGKWFVLQFRACEEKRKEPRAWMRGLQTSRVEATRGSQQRCQKSTLGQNVRVGVTVGVRRGGGASRQDGVVAREPPPPGRTRIGATRIPCGFSHLKYLQVVSPCGAPHATSRTVSTVSAMETNVPSLSLRSFLSLLGESLWQPQPAAASWSLHASR